jgi:hypothetical protein
MPDPRKSYERHTIPELIKAEENAAAYLEKHGAEIADSMGTKVHLLEALIQRVGTPGLEFGDRLETFADIADAARLLRTDANDFFDLASGPLVARIVRTVPPIKPKN